MGRFNNVARSLRLPERIPDLVTVITGRSYRKIDYGIAGGQPFFGHLALGFVRLLAEVMPPNRPRFAFGWSQLANRALQQIKIVKTVVKVDAFRFELTPRMLNIHLMPFAIGLELSPVSLLDDGSMEIVFDVSGSESALATYLRQSAGGKYVYGSDIRLFRGQSINLLGVKGRKLYLDGEVVEIPTGVLEIQMADKQLQVYSP
jgi:diacylglycerol kinase family enzyme